MQCIVRHSPIYKCQNRERHPSRRADLTHGRDLPYDPSVFLSAEKLMNSRIGAKLETLPPRRILSPTDYGYLLALLAISIFLHVWLVVRTTVTARDGIEFARIAINLTNPKAAPPKNDPQRTRTLSDVLEEAVHPPGYPAVIAATLQIVRRVSNAELPTQALRSAQIASIIAGILLIFPTYWLGRILLDSRFVGFAGAAFFQTLPTVSHVTSDSLSEAWYMLFATTSLLFAIRGLRRWSTLMFLIAGAFAALAYLVRPEGTMIVMVTGLAIVGLGVFRLRPRLQALGRLTALLAAFFVVGGPYMLAIGGFSNKETFSKLMSLWKGMPDRPRGALPQNPPQALRPVGSPELFAAWSAGGNRYVTSSWAAIKELSKACHYGIFVMGVLGLYLVRNRFREDPGFMLLGYLGIVNFAVLCAVFIARGYVSERHTLMLVLLICIFAATALYPLTSRFGEHSRTIILGLVLLLLAVNIPGSLKSPHANRTGHPHAGKYLAEHVQPNELVIDPFSWAEWYSGRSLYSVPKIQQADEVARWAILEPGASNHSRLPLYEAALNVQKDRDNPAKLVYWWPEDVPKEIAHEKAKVVVYRQQVK
jgi:hypothetical protein